MLSNFLRIEPILAFFPQEAHPGTVMRTVRSAAMAAWYIKENKKMNIKRINALHFMKISL
jgi:hypothetical protein